MSHIQYFSLIFLILKGNDFICIGLSDTISKVGGGGFRELYGGSKNF
jgi:hypothetical protein